MEQLIMQNGETLQTVVFFGLLVLFAGVELWLPARTIERGRSSRRRANWMLTTVNVATLLVLPVGLVTAALWAQERQVGLFNQVEMAVWATLVLNLLARGFISFFTHLLMHKVPAFWAVHRIHHLDTEMDVSTTVRFHPLEMVINLVPGIAIVVALGLSPWVLVLYEILDVALTPFSHANITLPQKLNRVLQYLIVTPDLHRIHHSSWQPETDSNFSAVFPIWDVLLGTFRPTSREPQRTMELGLEDVRDERTTSVVWMLLAPFRPNDEDRLSTEFEKETT